MANGGGPDLSDMEHIQHMESFSSGTCPELTEKVGPIQKRHNHVDQVKDLEEVGRLFLAKGVLGVLTERKERKEKIRCVLAQCARKKGMRL